jgi:GntR family transcriptional regulator/MocR family aminotransferase
MQQFFSLLSIDKHQKQPVYLQLANQLTGIIRKGVLQAGERLPSTRQLAQALCINRQTVVKAFDELLAQGWLQSHTGSGTFVSTHLPEIQPQALNAVPRRKKAAAGFAFRTAAFLNRTVVKPYPGLHLDDGFPDARLAPLEQLARAYRHQLLTGNSYTRLGYAEPNGSLLLRQQLCTYLHETRGLLLGPDNILITRGTTMGLYLTCTGLLEAGDTVAGGHYSWTGASLNFQQSGAGLVTLPADEHGIDTAALARLCRKQPVRMVYVTSHHHYPTTVALRAERRLQLLQLAATYGFIVFEDDYDYDFHYLSRPLLPLAAADQAGTVLYCGSFTKAISPAFRVGYLTGPAEVIQHLTRLRRLIDRQGDTILENAIAALLGQGVIQRHLRKSLRVYRERRDLFCTLLQQHLGRHISFRVPDGGLAVWAQFDKRINLPELAKKALQQHLYFADGSAHVTPSRQPHATRLGFASSTTTELEQSVEILRVLLGAKKSV